MRYTDIDEFLERYDSLPMNVRVGKTVVEGHMLFFPPEPGDVMDGYNRYDLHASESGLIDRIVAKPVTEGNAGCFLTKELLPLRGDTLEIDGISADYSLPW